MAIISRIRKRAGLIVALVAIALFSFVLSDMLFSGRSFFNSEQNAGEIAGTSISYRAYDSEVQAIAEAEKAQTRQAALSEEDMNAIRDDVWEKFIKELALKPQYRAAGITVSEKEVQELILGSDPDQMVVDYFSDRQTRQLDKRFADPMTGKLNPRAVKQMDDTLRAHQNEEGYAAAWQNWIEFQNRIPDARAKNKYLNLIKKGLYVTTEQAKQDYVNLNRSVGFKYFVKPYASMADSLVKVTDQDLLKYYNENSYKYKQEASRKLEYIVFDIKPTELDYAEVKAEMDKIAADWKEVISPKEDSLFIIREADTRIYDTTGVGKGKLPLQIDSLAHASEKGALLPMYIDNGSYKLTKVIGTSMSADSAKCRHILIKVTAGDSLGKIKAKAKIDSIKAVILKKNNFAEMVKKFSEDPGSIDSGGVYNWFGPKRMVPEFENACFSGKVGDMPIVLTQFGYHLIEIQGVSPRTRKTAVATIDRKIEPGTKTRQDVYQKAIDFISKYHTSETFKKGVEESHMIPRVADPLKENDKAIAGIESPREIIRWAFTAEKGDVSKDPFGFQDKYVVAYVAEVREEGIAPLEQKKEEVEIGAKKAKKAELFMAEMEKARTSTIEEYAAKLNLQAFPVESATFSSYSIPNVGREMKLYGPIFAMKQGDMSKPIAGETGVFVVKIEKITEAPATTDYSTAKKQAANNYAYRTEGEAIEAIKKNAEIKDNRGKFF